jgi:excinuclease ABC subunit B
MAHPIEETTRRRAIQVAYNTEHGVDPQPLRKKIADITDQLAREDADTQELLNNNRLAKGGKRGRSAAKGAAQVRADGLAAAPAEDLVGLIEQLTEQMHGAAAELQFEVAARIRDEVSELKKELRQMQAAGHA